MQYRSVCIGCRVTTSATWSYWGIIYCREGLASGYFGKPELTAERFVANPYGESGKRMYRTGDLVKWRSDGALEYISRADHQIKIRGFRIELAEIETVLQRHENIQQAVVMVREDRANDKRIIAYIVAEEKEPINLSEIRSYVSKSLANYMIPSTFVVLEVLPLTPNGKVDRKKLPAPDFNGMNNERVARNPKEEILCDLFAEVLGVSRISIDDNFFEMGGHSLLASRLMARIRETLSVELGIGKLFESPTVAELAKQLNHAKAQDQLFRKQVGQMKFHFHLHSAGYGS